MAKTSGTGRAMMALSTILYMGPLLRRPELRAGNRLRLAWCGDGTELLHEAEQVLQPPLLDDLAAGHAVDGDAAHRYQPTRGRDAEEVTPVGAVPCVAAHD